MGRRSEFVDGRAGPAHLRSSGITTQWTGSADGADGAVSIGVLGPLMVVGPGGPVPIPVGRESVLLAQLIARIGQPVGVDVLIEGLWPGDPPASAERTLHAHVARLRRRLEPGRAARQHGSIVTMGRAYTLAVPPAQLDARRFEELIGPGGRDADDGATLRAALGLWRGAAYEGFEDVPICAQDGRRLDALRLATIERRIDVDLAAGPDVMLVAELEGLVVDHPYRERFWEQLMLCLYRVGRQTDALAAYKRVRRVLVEEMGVEPGPGLRHLEAAILDHDLGLLSIRPAPPLRQVPPALDSAGPAFVGRDVELSALLDWWSSCRHGRGGFVSVVGPEGVGKTRLVAEMAAYVGERDGVVLYARCDHALVGPRPLFDAALRSQGTSMAEVVPGSDGLAVAAARHLAAWGDGRPILMVFDDLHLADGDTLSAVAELAEWCSSAPMLIVGAFRTDDLTAGAADRQVVLGGLDRAAVAAICDLYGVESWSSDDVSTVLEQSAGLPLAVHRSAADVAERSAVERLGAEVERLDVARRARTWSRTAATDAVLGLRQLVEQRRRYDRRPAGSAGDDNPYPGLMHYEEHDAEIFFGRDRLVAELVVRLASTDLVAVVGPSGSGKSSLVQAGVLAALSRGALPGSEGWKRATLTPGDDPRATLADALAGWDGDATQVLVVDQFEELYTLGVGADDRGQFLDKLCRLVDDGRTRVVIVVRSDQFGQLAEHPAMTARLTEATVLVGSLNATEMRRVVEGPARRAGVAVEPALTDEIVADLAGEVGTLPLVSTALAATWDRRTVAGLTVAGYVAAGRVSGAIAQLAEDAWGSMPVATQVAARRVLLRLVHPSGNVGEETRRRTRPQDVAAVSDVAAVDALTTLVEYRLLVTGDGTVEIAHEALLREWPRLAGWLAEDVDGRRLHHQVAAAATMWEEGGCDDGDLLRGARLAATSEWCSAGHEADLLDVERDFVAASVALSDRRLARARAEAQHNSRINRRLRSLLMGLAALLLAAVVAGVVAVRQADRADTQAAAALREADRADAEAAAANRETDRADAAARSADAAAQTADAAALTADAERIGALAGLEDELDTSLLLAAQAYSMGDTASTRAALLRAVQRSPQASRTVGGEGPPLVALEVSPDGTTIAVNENASGTALYDATSGRLLGHVAADEARQALTWTVDGTAFATVDAGAPLDSADPASMAFDVVVVDAATLQERARYTGRRHPASDLAFSPDGTWLVAAPTRDGTATTPELTVWDVARPGPPARTIELPDATQGDDDDVSFDAAGDHVAVSVGGATAVLDLETGERRATIDGGGGLFAPDGRTLAVNAPGDDATLDLVDIGTGERLHLDGGHSQRIRHRAFSRDGTLLMTAGDDRTVRVWDVSNGREIAVLAGHTGTVVAGAFSPDNSEVFSASLDRTIITWDLAADDTVAREVARGSTDPRSQWFSLTSDGSTAVAIPFETDLLVVDRLDAAVETEPIETGHGGALAVLPSGGTTVITGGRDGAIRRWDVATGALLAERGPVASETEALPLAVTSERDVLWVQTGLTTIVPLDAVTLEPHRSGMIDVGAPVDVTAVTPDGATVAVATFNPPTVWTVDVATGARRSIDVESDISALAFSPDGSLLVAGDGDGRVLRIDPMTTTLTGLPVVAHNGRVIGVTFADDGTRFASGSYDGTVGMWETASGRSIGTLQPGPPNARVRATWASDGYTLLTMYSDRSVDAFDTRPSSWLDHACRTAGRQLTTQEWTELFPDRPFDPACG